MSKLFTPLKIREIVLKNRLVVSPMCQYESLDGYVTDYHKVHYGRFALGGFGLVMVEATAVSPEGRITHGDVGLWKEEHIEGFKQIASFLKEQGAVAGIQIGHAGPKASMQRPYYGNGPLTSEDHARGDLPWPVVAASANPSAEGWLTPTALDQDGINKVIHDFKSAAERALKAGFDVLEFHCAHGYLMNSFLSPITNHRTDEYGGDIQGRMRLPLQIAKKLRSLWPEDKPFFVRVSAVDGVASGVTIEDSVVFAKELKKLGVDVVDCSSGGTGRYDYPIGYGYQTPFANKIKAEAGLNTMAVGLIVSARQAEEVIASEQADLVAIGREALRNPNFAFHAEQELHAANEKSPYENWPRQYGWWLNSWDNKIKQLGGWKSDKE